MVDLAAQHARIQGELDAAINGVMSATAFIKGPEIGRLEKALAGYLGCKHAIGCANGTDALQLALMAAGLAPGDEVITPSFTFVATAEVVRLLGLVPVFADVDSRNFNLDPASVEKLVSEKTKAIIPVHLYGQCAPMEELMAIAEKHSLCVIEDAAQALGTDYVYPDGRKAKAGTIGHIGCTSFFPSKNLGCAGDGGAVFTNEDQFAQRIRAIANHGQADQYHYQYIGINSRLDTLQAAILEVKLPHLDDYNRRRQQAAKAYTEAFSGIEALETPAEVPYSTHIYHQYTLKVKNGQRDQLAQWLDKHQIPNKVYYPVPVHMHEPYRWGGRVYDDELQTTADLAKEVISLPMHTELSDDQLELICSTVRHFFDIKR